jgi:hypothetical protein
MIHDDGIAVLVAYGTSQRANHLKVGESAISRERTPDALRLAGLAYDTKFDFKVTVELPWAEPSFEVSPPPRYGQSPKLGHCIRRLCGQRSRHIPRQPPDSAEYRAALTAS